MSPSSSLLNSSRSSSSAVAAAAESLQSCLTVCDPTDGSPPGSPIPGILQARALEWVAISFSSLPLKFEEITVQSKGALIISMVINEIVFVSPLEVSVQLLSRVRLFATP